MAQYSNGFGGLGKEAVSTEYARRAIAAGLFDAVISEYSMHYVLGSRGVVLVADTRWSVPSLLDAILAHLGRTEFPELNPIEKRNKLIELFETRRYLLLIHNLHVKPQESLDEVLTVLSDLTGKAYVILTSRQLPIYLPFDSIHLEPLDIENSTLLLKADAAARHVVQVQEASSELLQSICESTSGIPRALRIVVSQAQFLDIHLILNRLRGRPGGAAMYEVLFRQSWDQLSPLSKNILSALVRFESPATWEQLTQFALAEDETSAIEALGQLSSYSLIDIVFVDQLPAYKVPNIVRSFLKTELQLTWDQVGAR